MHPFRISCVLTAAVALAFAACGDDGGSGGGSETVGTAATGTGGGGATVSGERNTTGVTGSWRGEGTERDERNRVSRYPVEIEITSLEEGEDAGSVSYRSFPCSGRLRLEERRGDTYVLREQITGGERRCELQGRVELTRDGERLSYRWSTPRTKDLTVSAELEAR